jgi:Family of unknown function (DUF6152)
MAMGYSTSLRRCATNRRLSAVFAVAVGLLMTSVPAFSHHGKASYDTTKLVTVTGSVTDFEFTNPHVEIHVDVKDDKGNTVKWTAETSSPNLLMRVSWNKNTLKPGDQITLTGNPAKDGSNVMRLDKIVMPDGKELHPYVFVFP